MSNTDPNSRPAKACASDSKNCGSCGGPGLCPGIALMLSYMVGGGLTILTGLHWLGWAVGVPLAIILLTGAWRFIPKAKAGKS